MARPSNSDRLMLLDADGYFNELKYQIRLAIKEIRAEIMKELKSSAGSLPYKKNEIKMAGGVVTSDFARRKAVINAIDSGMKDLGNDVFQIAFTAFKRDFKDSHIGIYYEHGTGQYWDRRKEPADESHGGSYNRYRFGRQIVSRSRHIDYSGEGKGKWIDLGGNIRITGSREAGRRTDGFIRYIGEDIRAYHWFSKVFDLKRDWTLRRLRAAVMEVRLTNFLRIRKRYILGKDGVMK